MCVYECVRVCARVLERVCVCTCVRICMCFCACVHLCEYVHLCICVCMCVYVCVCECVCVCVCTSWACAFLLHACIPVNFISCITTECQCSANRTFLWGQTKVCEFCMAASCSCAPLPLTHPGLLLPAAGGRGLGGNGQAERGAFSPLVTLNNTYFLLPPP